MEAEGPMYTVYAGSHRRLEFKSNLPPHHRPLCESGATVLVGTRMNSGC